MKSSKLNWANDLRAFATLAVITLHVASSISMEYPAISKPFFFTSVFFDSAVRWCVPVFIMLTGSFALEHYDGRLKDFFTKLFYRIILPFLFWSLACLVFFSWDELNDPNKNLEQLLSFIGKQFLSGTASHLWFVYIIVSLYLIFPFLSKWTKVAVEKEYILFFILWVLTLLLGDYLSESDSSFDLTFFSGYIGFLVLGNYLYKSNRKISTLLLFAFFLIGLFYTIVRTYYISINANANKETFMDNLSVNVCLMAYCVYLIFKSRVDITNPTYRKLIDIICQHSYGIYLSHLLILNIFLSTGINFYFIHPLLSIPLISICCLCISCLLLIGLKKVPLLKYLVG